jgi:hypothetical protein
MIVPEYWAEARKQYRAGGKQVTVRRYGWSNTSEADALSNAEIRADEALRRILAGDHIAKREPKVPYNGAEGVPVREEVLARHGEQVITRNSYGAHCLNSPNALFADIDFESERSARPTLFAFIFLLVVVVIVGLTLQKWSITVVALVAAIMLAVPLGRFAKWCVVAVRGGAEHIARTRVVSFLSRNPSWGVRLYRTPAGYRLLATHQSFEADSQAVQHFFQAVSADPIYVRMCINQRCFRARLTAKPWRIGISAHMRPRPGIWPVQPELRSVRDEWLRKYEVQAASYSACQYIESLGSGIVDESIREVIELHDRESRALIIGAKIA